PTKNLPANMRYVGPILWQPRMPAPCWLDQLHPEKPTVYFTAGSSGHAKIFDFAVNAFGNTGYQVVMTTGGQPFEMTQRPKNIFIADFAPGLDLMQRSSVVVSHGGNGTVYQAIAAGCPLIGMPSHLDQDFNLQRVRDLGIGIRLSAAVKPQQV